MALPPPPFPRVSRQLFALALGACLALPAWAVPLPPVELPGAIQNEFVRLYQLPDHMLRLQLEPALEIFPEYREDLVRYLGEDASPQRQALLADIAKATQTERLAWFRSTPGKLGLVAAAVGAGALASKSGGGGGSSGEETRPPAPQPPSAPQPVPVPPQPPVAPEPVPVPPQPPVAPEPVPVPPQPPVAPEPAPVPPQPPADPDPEPPEEPAPPAEPVDPEQFRTAEFQRTWGLSSIRAEHAYARGATGAGVTVAVVDTGVDIDHPELSGRIAPGGEWVRDGGPRMTDGDGHGTHVAGTIAAARDGQGMHGVAPEARILPIKFLHDGVEGSTTLGTRDALQRQVELGARISNNSWGERSNVATGGYRSRTLADLDEGQRAYYRDTLAPLYREAQQAGMVFVFAAGNNTSGNTALAAQPSLYAALPVLLPELQGQWLAVVNIQSDGRISAGSHRCGDARAWCLAAPGSMVYSSMPGDGYAHMSGTSMAAPHVSGALALLMDLFPTLSAAQITQRTLVSADRSGIYADADTYGQGLLDLQAASNPIGVLMINTASGELITLDQAGLAQSPALGNALRQSLARVDLVLKDSLDAPFRVSGEMLAEQAGSQRTRIDSEAYRQRLEQEHHMQTLSDGRGLQLRFSGAGEGSGLQAMGQVQAWQQLGDLALSASFNTDPSWSQGLARLDSRLSDSGVTQAFGNPYLSLGQQATGAGMHWQFAPAWSASLQVQLAEAEQRFADRSDSARQQGMQSEWRYQGEHGLSASLQLGVLTEQQRLLGTQGEQWLGGADSHTWFQGLNLSLALNEHWQLFGRYNTGLSKVSGGRWLESANLRSDSFTLGLLGEPHAQWQLGALVYQPLRVSGGEARLQLPTGLNADNSVAWSSTALELSAQGRHMEYELFFRYELPRLPMSFKGSLLHVRDYQNQPGNNDSMLLLNTGLRY
ncbi:S8 family peptidase [Ectopseudomonas alcaliphila]|uniref:S8 family peptidase n=1 Tax=Ectopseudomonas alcaliphila TaxID=101564 RepID=UPI0027810444|nr:MULTISPECIES: S8 family peptidase [Pseudomonas]MDP9938760.1 subtilisin family serine protease [Pseudomonas sp. 3400]MDR7010983.1 subtilisin family serine protease [Pseudomonas alcaliphila]